MLFLKKNYTTFSPENESSFIYPTELLVLLKIATEFVKS